MTRRPPDSLEKRLAAWFASEVGRARLDPGSARRVIDRAQRQRPVWPGIAIASVAVLAVLGLPVLGLRRDGPPPASSAPSGPVSSAPPAGTSHRVTAWSPDGIPSEIDGEPVLRPTAFAGMLADVADDRPFLVRGWLVIAPPISCPYTASPPVQHRLAPFCSGSEGLGIAEARGFAPRLGLLLTAPGVTDLPTDVPLVVRLHTHDREAADCPVEIRDRCDSAIAIDEVVWSAVDSPPVIAWSPDGLPTEIDGQRVLRVAEASRMADETATSMPFLVLGRLAAIVPSCTLMVSPPPEHELAPRCMGGHYVLDPATGDALRVFRAVSERGVPMVVVRVHTLDLGARECAPEIRERCERAVVVESVVWRAETGVELQLAARYPDGVPQAIGGEPVMRARDGASRVGTIDDDSPFLVGGWMLPRDTACPPPPVDVDLQLADCGRVLIGEPGGDDSSAYALLVIPRVSLPTRGAVVVRIHTLDPAAVRCPVAVRSACERAVVVDEVVWQGDRHTQTEPLTIVDVVRRLEALRDQTGVLRPEVLATDSGACVVPYPPQSWRLVGPEGEPYGPERRIRRVLVFPAITQRERRHDSFMPGTLVRTGDQHGEPCLIFEDGQRFEWVAVDNVMVEVTSVNPTLKAAVERALRAS